MRPAVGPTQGARVVSNWGRGELPFDAGGDTGAIDFHRTLPGYQPTPLIDARPIAEALNLGRVWVKDESARLGMGSFKILGASWASYRAVCEWLERDPEPLLAFEELRDELSGRPRLCLVAATDGNHGHAVARVARLLGADAHILVPADMVRSRRIAIASEGACVTVVQGSYDDAVEHSSALADDRHLVVSDTSWPGYERIPGWVVDGYQTIGSEVDVQLVALGADAPDVVVAQIGVGAFAAAMIRYAKRLPGARTIGVEPTGADCVTRSIEAGRLIEVPGPHTSIMAGLNCGRASQIAWPVISAGLDSLVVIEDGSVREAMRLLARAGIVSGESGAAGLGGLMWARDRLDLRVDETVLLVCTEGATDPESYERIVGRAPA